MSTVVRLAVCVVLAATIAGCGWASRPKVEPAPPRTPLAGANLGADLPEGRSLAERGRAYYEHYCTDCHGETGGGDGPAAGALRPSPTNFTDREYMREQRPEYYFRAITAGVPGSSMSRWDHRIDAPDRWDTAFYVWSLISGPEVVTHGRTVYFDLCVECHGADGNAEPDAPLGAAERVRASRASTSAALAAVHAAEDVPATADDVDAVVEYVWTFLYEPAPAR